MSAVSSLVMVPVAVASEISAFVAFDSVTVKVSSSSTISSLTVVNVAETLTSPGLKVSTCDCAVKSAGDSAVSPLSADAVMVTVTVLPLVGVINTENDTKPNDSDVETSATLSVGGSSSSTIVPVAVGSVASCALADTPDSVTVNVSFVLVQ